jgi:ubiquinone/menaquinone biosynthesis C-methylase UbiE
MSHDQIAATFDEWVRSGIADGMEDEHGDVVEQVLESLQPKAGERILELGCGLGWATRRLARLAPGVQAIGVDASPEMVKKAEESTSLTVRARFEVCPFEALDFKDVHFDRAFSMEALYYAADLHKALSEVCRVLKPGAPADLVLNFYADNPGTRVWAEQIGTPMLYLSEAEWKQRLADAGFTTVEAKRVIDRRGPGDPADFCASEWSPSFERKREIWEAGSLWLHAVR